MKLFTVCALFAAAANANPSQFYAASPWYNQFHSQDNLGQYSYGYNGGLSSKTETKSLDGVTRGSYSYVDSNGILQTTEYTADAVNGFRAAATNLPRAPLDHGVAPQQIRETPEVAKARADHLRAFNEIAYRKEDIHPVELQPIQARIITPNAAAPLSTAPHLLMPNQISALGQAPAGSFAYSFNNAPSYAYFNAPTAFAYQSIHPIVPTPQYIYTPNVFARASETIPTNEPISDDSEEVSAATDDRLSAPTEQKD